MKAGRRHELKENDLVHALSVARDYLDARGKQIGVLVILALAVAAAVALTVRSQAAAREDRWRRMDQLSFADPGVGKRDLEALAAMTQDVSDTRFVFTSLVRQGEHALRLAQDAPVPPDAELNQRAREAFERLLERFKDKPLAFGIAHCGLATVEENSFVLDGDPAHKEQAESHLAAIIDNPALNGMPFKRMAMDRRKVLGETFTRMTFKYPEPPEEHASPMPDDVPVDVEFVEEADDADAELSPLEPADSGASDNEPIDTP